MVGYLTPPGQPQTGFNLGQFGGDALSALGAGLLAYSGGGAARQNAGLVALQALHDAQQGRQEQAYRALQTQSMQQQMALQQQQADRQQQAIDQANQQRQKYLSLLGGQPIQGPTQSGAPLDMKSPVNPVLANLPAGVQATLPLMDPDQGINLLTQLATRKPQIPQIEHVRKGNQDVSGYFDPNDPTKFIPVASGDAFAPQQSLQKLSLNPTYYKDAQGNLHIGQLGMDGNMHDVVLPQGAVPAPGVSQIDTGTGTVVVDNKGATPITTVAKDVQGAAAQKASGTAQGTIQGTVQATLPDTISSADRTLNLVKDIKSDPNLGNATGILGIATRNIPGTSTFALNEKIKQLQSQTFLDGITAMKGMGALSDAEGSRVSQAIARLNPQMNKADFQTALDDISATIGKAKLNLLQKAKGGGASSGTPSQSAPAQSAPQAPVSGAKQAPDGNWYVPDPNRPGKYLQVVQ